MLKSTSSKGYTEAERLAYKWHKMNRSSGKRSDDCDVFVRSNRSRPVVERTQLGYNRPCGRSRSRSRSRLRESESQRGHAGENIACVDKYGRSSRHHESNNKIRSERSRSKSESKKMRRRGHSRSSSSCRQHSRQHSRSRSRDRSSSPQIWTHDKWSSETRSVDDPQLVGILKARAAATGYNHISDRQRSPSAEQRRRNLQGYRPPSPTWVSRAGGVAIMRKAITSDSGENDGKNSHADLTNKRGETYRSMFIKKHLPK